MALGTRSAFYYGYTVDETNFYIPFDEGAGELNAEITLGAYSLTEFLVAVKTALDAAGTQAYTVEVDRDTRQITISATSSFDLLISSGTTTGTSAFSLMGFTGSDLTGLTSYTGDASGYEYVTQFPIQDYVAPNYWQEKIQPSVNESAAGEIEVISFGTRKWVEMNIMYVNEIISKQTGPIAPQIDAEQNTIDFMVYLISKAPIEFMPNVANRSSYYTMILERTPQNGDGVGFNLAEMVSRNMAGYYMTGLLRFRLKE